MGIQSSVLSMMGSLGSLQQTVNANRRKALNIALGAATGGAGGAITAAAKEAGVNSKAVGHLTGTATDVLGDTPVQQSPQAQAAQTAKQSAANAIEAKRIQREQNKKLVEAYNRGDFQNLPIDRQQKIAKRVSEVENGRKQ